MGLRSIAHALSLSRGFCSASSQTVRKRHDWPRCRFAAEALGDRSTYMDPCGQFPAMMRISLPGY